MFMFSATAAPTRHPSGEVHSPSASAPLVTTLAAGTLPVNRASEPAQASGGGCLAFRDNLG
ncbi:MAG: hypothetical protein JNL18_12425 [Planctomycetaceae bacterium]|nr:hypothetical protein [Planctomycetaceae bacterium]